MRTMKEKVQNSENCLSLAHIHKTRVFFLTSQIFQGLTEARDLVKFGERAYVSTDSETFRLSTANSRKTLGNDIKPATLR